MFVEHALDCPGDSEILCADDGVFAERSEWRPWNDLLLVFGHDSLPFAVTVLLSDLRDLSAGGSDVPLLRNARSS